MKTNYLVIIFLIALAGGIGFFGGIKYQKSQGTQSLNNRNGLFSGQRGGRFGNGGAALGEIINLDGSSITIKMQDGTSKIILISGRTKFTKTSQASNSDLKVGERVAAFGNPNSDGSLTAANIQINPFTQNFRSGMMN